MKLLKKYWWIIPILLIIICIILFYGKIGALISIGGATAIAGSMATAKMKIKEIDKELDDNENIKNQTYDDTDLRNDPIIKRSRSKNKKNRI